jgi:hypothetical protein
MIPTDDELQNGMCYIKLHIASEERYHIKFAMIDTDYAGWKDPNYYKDICLFFLYSKDELPFKPNLD